MTCGDCSGDTTDELGPAEHIEDFVSGVSKSYAYWTVNAKTLERKTVWKVLGIMLNYTTALLFNFDSMRDIILGVDTDDVFTVHTVIKCKSRKRDGTWMHGTDAVAVVSGPENKMY
jgi:hypothetical protein